MCHFTTVTKYRTGSKVLLNLDMILSMERVGDTTVIDMALSCYEHPYRFTVKETPDEIAGANVYTPIIPVGIAKDYGKKETDIHEHGDEM